MDYPRPVLEREVDQTTFRLIGVTHTGEFFSQNKEFLTNRIEESSAIIIEKGLCSPFGPGPKNAFYQEIIREAAENDLPVYVLDASNAATAGLEAIQLVAGAAIAGRSLSGLYPRGGMTRRQFVKNGIGTLAALWLLSGSAAGRTLTGEIADSPETTIDDLLGYGTMFDYRNLVSAYNLIKLANHLDEQESPVIDYFIGYEHINGISAYLDHPEFLSKRILYLPQDAITDSSVRKYVFDGGAWNLEERF